MFIRYQCYKNISVHTSHFFVPNPNMNNLTQLLVELELNWPVFDILSVVSKLFYLDEVVIRWRKIQIALRGSQTCLFRIVPIP